MITRNPTARAMLRAMFHWWRFCPLEGPMENYDKGFDRAVYLLLRDTICAARDAERVIPVSNCCSSPVIVAGKTTKYYSCSKCGKSCDTKADAARKNREFIEKYSKNNQEALRDNDWK